MALGATHIPKSSHKFKRTYLQNLFQMLRIIFVPLVYHPQNATSFLPSFLPSHRKIRTCSIPQVSIIIILHAIYKLYLFFYYAQAHRDIYIYIYMLLG